MNLDVATKNIHWSTNYRLIPLPTDNGVRNHIPITSIKTPSGVRAGPPTTQLGPFCRTAEATTILRQVLDFVSSPLLDNLHRQGEDVKLDESLQSLAMSLLQQATNGWEECCAAIALCLW